MATTRIDPLKGISSMATRNTLAELAEVYARRTAQRVVIESAGGVDAARRVRANEPFDFVVLAADAIDALAASANVDRKTRVDVAQSGIAIAAKAGTPRRDVSNERAVRDTVLCARSIGYSTGPSGSHMKQLFDRWEITDTIATRIVQAPPGVPVGALIAKGDVELGFQQLSELIDLSGVEVIGLLPPEIQATTVFSAAVCNGSRQPVVANAFLSFVASPQADAVKRRHGMEPASPSPSATKRNVYPSTDASTAGHR
jgi:molybdate transport system substrate-binding protein